MKAKEYYEKYKEKLADPENGSTAASELMTEFNNEMVAMIKQRKAQTDRAFFSIVNEMNNKWNALCEMFDPPVLRRNGFKAVVFTHLGLNPKMKKVSPEEFERLAAQESAADNGGHNESEN